MAKRTTVAQLEQRVDDLECALRAIEARLPAVEWPTQYIPEDPEAPVQ